MNRFEINVHHQFHITNLALKKKFSTAHSEINHHGLQNIGCLLGIKEYRRTAYHTPAQAYIVFSFYPCLEKEISHFGDPQLR